MTVFGVISTLQSFEGTLTFIGFLIFLVFLEAIFHNLESAAASRDMKELFEKLQKELMMMGIISFAVFIFETALPGLKDGSLFLSFEMTHLIVLFMALAFIFQAIFLVSYASVSGKRYLAAMRAASTDLLMQYKKLKNDDRKSWWFHFGSSLLPVYPAFRTDIEFRIIERLFIFQHKLSHDFNFAHYVNALFKVYTAELGEVSAFSWFLLACLVAINSLRIVIIDPSARGPNCSNVPSSSYSDPNSGTAAHRMLSGGESTSSVACDTYVLIYAYSALALLSCMALAVYYAATVYVDRIIYKSLAIDNIDSKCRFGYEYSLVLMIRKDKMLSHGIMDSQVTESIKFKPSRNKYNVVSPTQGTESPLPSPSRWAVKSPFFNLFSRSERLKRAQELTEPAGNSTDLCGIFLFKSPGLFFKAVEAILLFQCFAISMIATQLLPLVVSSYHNAAWTIGFIIPIALNFYIIQIVLNKAVLLRSVHTLEREIAGKICENAVEERGAIANLRAVMSMKLLEEDIPEDDRKVFLHNFFFQYDKGQTGLVSKADFLRILGDLSIYMSKESFQLLWQAVDYDLSGGLDWKEISELFFPNEKAAEETKENNDIPALRDLRAAMHKMLADANIQVFNWEAYLREAFNKFDTDKSNMIDESEFEAMLNSLGVTVSSKVLLDAFSTIDICQERNISYEDFFAFLFPEAV